MADEYQKVGEIGPVEKFTKTVETPTITEGDTRLGGTRYTTEQHTTTKYVVDEYTVIVRCLSDRGWSVSRLCDERACEHSDGLDEEEDAHAAAKSMIEQLLED